MGPLEDARHLLANSFERTAHRRLWGVRGLKLSDELRRSLYVRIDGQPVVAAEHDREVRFRHVWNGIVGQACHWRGDLLDDGVLFSSGALFGHGFKLPPYARRRSIQIGRASCRER